MDEEFKLCWKNFQDNIASGFQNLYDRGDLVDVTLACDGKLLHAHKIVLAICSPYFQEIFASNPCKHPTIILKDVNFNIMCELLEFMYQGVVNVKQTELQSFMKVGQFLQIKGLATNSSSSASTSSEKSPNNSANNNNNNSNNNNNQTHNSKEANQNIEENELNTSMEDVKPTKSLNENETDLVATKTNANAANRSRSPSTPTAPTFPCGLVQQQQLKSENSSPLHQAAAYHAANAALKRQAEFASAEAAPLFSVKKQLRRSLTSANADQNSDLSDANESGNGMDSMSTDDFLLPSISMVESRYDLSNPKREGAPNSERDYRENAAAAAAAAAAVSLRNPFGAPFGFDYNLYKNSSNASSAGGSSSSAGGPQTEYPNELHMPNDYSKNFGNHMEIPSNGNNLVMLSSTSLLHGNCVFNRNNTVATQQGMKTYWLCKSYRVSMCRARCITHQGRIISATGVHNHPPHMRGGNNSSANSAAILAATLSNNNNSSSSGGGNYATTAETSLSTQAPTPATGLNAVHLANSVNNSALCSSSIHSLARLSQNPSSSANSFAHNLHGSQHAAQQHPQSPPPLFSHSTATAAGHQLQQPLAQATNTHSGNGVIQNMFQNAANLMQLPNMLPPATSQHHEHQLHQQHSPHLNHHHHQHHQHHHHHQNNQHQPNLEITSLMHATAPLSLASSSNTALHHHHHHGHNAVLINHSPSIKGEATNNNNSALHDLSRSPSHLRLGEDAADLANEQILVRNEPLSPSPDINSATNNTVGSSADVSLSSSSQAEAAEHEAAHHQAQVIDSITISPPNVNDSAQHFKMEDI